MEPIRQHEIARTRRGALATAAAGAIAVACLAQTAAGSAGAGNPKAGRTTFVSTCGVCHTLRAAKSTGKLGPDLDKVKLSEPTLVEAITKGGASVMSKAAVARYTSRMTAYGDVLTPAQIRNVAAFVYTSTHQVAAKAALAAGGHRPKVNVRWHYVVRATLGGKPTAAKLTVQVVDPTGRAHPVQLGATGKNVTNRSFKGVFKDFVVWPATSRGVPLTLRVTVRIGHARKVLRYGVTPKA
jgi:cytochrome c6